MPGDVDELARLLALFLDRAFAGLGDCDLYNAQAVNQLHGTATMGGAELLDYLRSCADEAAKRDRDRGEPGEDDAVF